MGRAPRSLQKFSYSLFCRKKINKRIFRIKKNWDEISQIICGSGCKSKK